MQYETSIKDFNGALELDSNYSKAYFSRATSYLLLKKTDKAIEDFNRSLECEEEVD
jgi:tetratricopeptide (TPR) repeat protein